MYFYVCFAQTMSSNDPTGKPTAKLFVKPEIHVQCNLKFHKTQEAPYEVLRSATLWNEYTSATNTPFYF